MDIFSRLEGRLSGDYGGRFFAIVLEQVCRAEPEILLSVFPALKQDRRGWKALKNAIRTGDSTLQLEVPFIGEDKGRRADFWLEVDGIPIAIAEIKYEDHKVDGVEKQIEDNIEEAKRHGACFTYLTLYPSSLEIKGLIRKANRKNSRGKNTIQKHCARTYRDVYEAAKKLRKHGNEIVGYFCSYMEGKFPMFKEDLGGDAEKKLTFLLLRSLYVKHSHGFGKHSVGDNPFGAFDIARDLMRNIQAVADYFHNSCPGMFKQRPRPTFAFEPGFNLAKIKRALRAGAEVDEEEYYFDRNDRSAGYFRVESAGAILSGDTQYMYVGFGLEFYLDMNEKSVTTARYVSLHGKNIPFRICYTKFSPFRSKISEKKLQAQILKLLKTSVLKTEDVAGDKKPSKNQKTRLKQVMGHLMALESPKDN